LDWRLDFEEKSDNLAANDVVDDILEVVVNALIIGPLFFAA
jgi:hypothetical protein